MLSRTDKWKEYREKTRRTFLTVEERNNISIQLTLEKFKSNEEIEKRAKELIEKYLIVREIVELIEIEKMVNES